MRLIKVTKIDYKILILSLLIVSGIISQFYYGFSWADSSCHSFASDDAFITYRYAQNLYFGNGAYYNILDEKVEGYSNFLYLLLLTPGFMLTSDNIFIYSTILNTLLLFITLFFFYKLLTRYFTKNYSIIGLGLVGLNPSVWANVTTGLETILVILIFTVLWLTLESKRDKLNISLIFFISSLAMLARVDGFIFPVIAAIFLFLNNEKQLGLKLFIFSIIFMLIYALGRYIYYDDIISNTYYAKVSGDLIQRFFSGIDFLQKQTLSNGIAFYFLFLIIFVFNNIINKKKILKFPIIFTFIWLTYLIYIGGDIYYERFLLPFLIIGVFYFLLFLKNRDNYAKYLVPIALLISFIVFYNDGRFKYEDKDYDAWVTLGKFLKKSPDNYVLAIDAAGKVPYYSQLKTIDMLGLNNKTIGQMKVDNRTFKVGHTKHNVKYTLSQSPNIISAWVFQSQNMAWGLSKKRYKNKYLLKYLLNTKRKSKPVNIYDVQKFKNSEIKSLIKNGYNYGVLVRKDSLDKMPQATDKINLK